MHHVSAYHMLEAVSRHADTWWGVHEKIRFIPASLEPFRLDAALDGKAENGDTMAILRGV
jgi:hypothetical protein